MNKIKLIPLALALGFSTLSVQAIAWEGDISHEGNKAYAKDSNGDIVRDSWGGCVRTIHWTKKLATAKCEGWPEPVAAAPAPVAAPVEKPKPAPARAVMPKPAPVPVVAIVAPVVAAPVAPEPVKDAESEIKVAKPLSFSGFFETNGNNLSAKAKQKLDQYVEYLNAHPTEKVVVTGYTDDRGAAAYNQKLSEQRAKAVQSYFTSKGIEANRVTAKGKGESNPIADNGSADGRAQNRRVELDIRN